MVFIKRLIVLMLLCSTAFATISNNTVWEVRTAGSDNNGGGFVAGASGTDRSQSNTAFCSATDLVLVTTTTATSATCPFSAASIGNLIHITAGTNCTVGFYEVTSVASVTATLDRVAGTTGCTTGTFALGGALLSPVTAAANAGTSNTVWLKNDGTYTITASIAFANGGNNTSLPLSIQGYTTTRGDTGRAIITSATNSVSLLSIRTNTLASNLTMSHTATTRGICITDPSTATSLVIANSSMNGCSVGISIAFGWSNVNIVNVEILNSISQGILQGSTNAITDVTIQNSWIHANGSHGVELQCSACIARFLFTVLSSNTGDGGRFPNAGSTSGSPFDNTIYFTNSVAAYNTDDGLEITRNTRYRYMSVTNSIFTGNATFDINSGLVPGYAVSLNNAFRGSNNNYVMGTNTVTLTADPFTSTTNFALNSASGGGALLKRVGWPGVALYGTGYSDIGPLQGPNSGGKSAYAN